LAVCPSAVLASAVVMTLHDVGAATVVGDTVPDGEGGATADVEWPGGGALLDDDAELQPVSQIATTAGTASAAIVLARWPGVLSNPTATSEVFTSLDVSEL
jgi:hypothetical protein